MLRYLEALSREHVKLNPDKSKVILLDARMFGFSGIGTYLENLIENYARMECEFSFRLACPRQESVREFSSD